MGLYFSFLIRVAWDGPPFKNMKKKYKKIIEEVEKQLGAELSEEEKEQLVDMALKMVKAKQEEIAAMQLRRIYELEEGCKDARQLEEFKNDEK